MARKFITALTARSALPDAEVNDALTIELARERAEADKAMAVAIAAGRRRTYYLSPAIFDPIDKLRDHHDRAARALANTKETGLVLEIIKGGERQSRVELETAIQLRAIRLTVSHADPEDYWDQWKRFSSSQPIVVNGSAL
jgi:hypothetical protein